MISRQKTPEMTEPLLLKRVVNNGSGGCHDTWAAIMFIINVLVVIYLAVLNTRETSPDDYQAIIGLATIFTILNVTAVLLATFWLTFIMHYATSIIYFTLYTVVAIFAVLSCGALLSGSLIGGAMLGVAAVANYFYISRVENRIPFASTVLNIVSKCTQKNYIGILLSSYAVATLTMLWMGLFVYGVPNVLQGGDNSSWEWIKIFLAMVSFHWYYCLYSTYRDCICSDVYVWLLGGVS
jgi:hypothetical protein